MADSPTLIRQPVCRIFRRAYIKRRSAATGLYEADWFEITKYVKSFGSAETTTDDVRINQFVHSGITLRCRNDESAFEPETNSRSLWHGYLTRNRTMVKIEAGYYDTDYSEQADDASVGIFILDDEIPISYVSNDVDLMCKSIVAPLEATRANEIAGLTNSMTAFQFVSAVRDATDGADGYLFRNFVTSTAWTIQTTTTVYTSVLDEAENYSVWDLMTKFAEAETFVVSATRTGGIEFRSRDPRTTAPAHYFYGNMFRKPNIISVDTAKEATEKLYTNFRLKFQKPDTTTSYVSAGVPTEVNDSNVSWIYGQRNYEFENTFFGTTTAQAVVDRLFAEFSTLRNEAYLRTKFYPGVEVLDRVAIQHRTFALSNVGLWDAEDWASDTATDPDDGLTWNAETFGLDWENKEFVVLSKTHHLDDMVTEMLVREV
jgi:hypothetical protein